MPERLATASRAAPAGATPPLGQDQHTVPASCLPRSPRFQSRICLRKGCGRIFQARCWNQRYCQDPECLKLLRRWQAAKRQRQRRSRPEVRHERAVATRKQRAIRRQEQLAAPETPDALDVNRKEKNGAWSRSEKNSVPFCDRPGCYEGRRPSRGRVARYCGHECGQAMRQVRDRERKWLSRKTAAGRFKRRLEYQTRRAARHGGAATAKDHAPNLLAGERSAAVVGYEPPSRATLPCGDLKEVPVHDPQTPACSRPRAPPSA
jgi:hypothetical protein